MPQALVNLGSVVVLLGGLIFVHEFGHFVVAKLMGVKVVRFSIGFGPRILGVRRGETEYRLSVLPLGGYVKMAGDDPSEPTAPEDRGRGFLEQRPWKRLLIALAGPAANLFFPGLIYLGLDFAQNGQETPAAIVGTVAPGSAADRAGLRPGDRILTVEAPGGPPQTVRWFSDLRELVSPHSGTPLTFRIERDGRPMPPLTIVPTTDRESNPIETTERGVIGVTPTYPPAVVAPATPGAAGALEPFDLVTAVDGKPVRNGLELERAIAAADCRPVALAVVRERALTLPGANVAEFQPLELAGVPTCAGREPLIRLADQTISGFIGAVEPGSPADRAGIRRGDAIVAVDGKPIRSLARDLRGVSEAFKPGVPVKIGLADGRTVELVPGKLTRHNEVTGKDEDVPVVGFHAGQAAEVEPKDLFVAKVPVHRGVGEVVSSAVDRLQDVVRITVLGIVRILTGHISAENVGGPLMLFNIAKEAAKEGWETFLFEMALISVNLGLMNLLPIPVLDGGHIAQAVVESVTRRPLSVRAREIANIVGLILLFLLMGFVFKNDIVRMFQQPPLQ